MKKILLATTLISLLAAHAAGEHQKEPTAESAETAARVHAMADAFRPSVVTVRFRLKTQPDGSRPNANMSYRCPACKNGWHHISYSAERGVPCLVTGFVLGANRVLVQDLSLRADWIDRLEVVCGTNTIAARPTLSYPDENAVLLETEHPLVAARPLTFTGDATNAPALFHVLEDADGCVKAGLQKIIREFTYYPVTGEGWCPGMPNTLVVDASNRAVSVQMRLDRPLGSILPKPPAQWRSEPFAARETRIAALEKRLLASVLPVYLHIDEEKKRGDNSRHLFSTSSSGRCPFLLRRISPNDERKLTGDVDTFGLVLSGGDVLIPLNLDSGKIAALDRMEATLPDGKTIPLEFAGAFAEYGLFLLRFTDGRVPDGVQPLTFATAMPDALMYQTAYIAEPQNQNGKIQFSLAPRQIRGFKRAHGGAVVPEVAPGSGSGEMLLLESGELAALSGHMRSARPYTSIPGNALARLIAARDFDPEFAVAVRKGKDRIRVAWIGVETQAMTKDLAREKKSQEFLAQEDGLGSLVGKVYANTPAAKVGIKEGDVLLWVRRATSERREKHTSICHVLETRENNRFDDFSDDTFDSSERTPWPQVESGVNGVFTRLGIGTKVVIAWVSGGEKHEAELVLEQAPVNYRTARRIRNRTLGLVAADLTFEVRAYLKLADNAPGVVITKMQPGSPSAMAGLHPFEVIMSVNGEPVTNAIRFAELIKDKKDLTFSVRRLDDTRIVRIQLKALPPTEKSTLVEP